MFGWRESYKVHIQKIDEQHRELFALIDELDREARREGALPTLIPLLGSVVSHTRAHFATEEQLMREHQYPDIAIHKRLHDALLAQAVDLQEKANRKELTLPMVVKFLEFWISHHISEADRRLGLFLVARGVK